MGDKISKFFLLIVISKGTSTRVDSFEFFKKFRQTQNCTKQITVSSSFDRFAKVKQCNSNHFAKTNASRCFVLLSTFCFLFNLKGGFYF